MYGFYAQGSETMVCQHIADWSRQVLNYLDELRERGIPSERLAKWRERFAALESEAATLLNPWQWSMQGVGAVAKLLDQAYNALVDFTEMLREITDGGQQEKGRGHEPRERRELREPREMTPGEIRPVPIGEHVLPDLPYPYDALEPHIDQQTMRLHHDKHHKSYVDGLNKAEREMEEARRTGNFDLIKHWEREAAFNGAGHYLHTVFWNIMSPQGGGEPTGAVRQQIEQDFGSFDRFKQHFSRAAEKVEAVGWAIWVWSPRANRTEILTAEKHQNLSQWEAIPLLPLDVWEHAYYLKYQNERKKYIDAWWNVVDWASVARRLEKARGLTWKPF
ncbi:MAG: superoxide dismutase [Bacillota bacterium]